MSALEILMPNHPTHENSLHLLKHANNPVDWFPWGDESLPLTAFQLF
jgi:uncharacterized protein YyaL (SSP411 family)